MWLFEILFSSLLQLWYFEVKLSRSISQSPLEFKITRVNCTDIFLILQHKINVVGTLEGSLLMSTHNMFSCRSKKNLMSITSLIRSYNYDISTESNQGNHFQLHVWGTVVTSWHSPFPQALPKMPHLNLVLSMWETEHTLIHMINVQEHLSLCFSHHNSR